MTAGNVLILEVSTDAKQNLMPKISCRATGVIADGVRKQGCLVVPQTSEQGREGRSKERRKENY